MKHEHSAAAATLAAAILQKNIAQGDELTPELLKSAYVTAYMAIVAGNDEMDKLPKEYRIY